MKKITLLALTSVAVISATACTPTRNTRGNLLQDYQIADVQPGMDTKSDVLRKLGSPTTMDPFDEDVWYYIGQETEKRGILDPEVTNERIIVATFDSSGILLDLKDEDNERIDLPYVRRKTPTSGNEVTVMQQLLGNLGRFNKQVEE